MIEWKAEITPLQFLLMAIFFFLFGLIVGKSIYQNSCPAFTATIEGKDYCIDKEPFTEIKQK